MMSYLGDKKKKNLKGYFYCQYNESKSINSIYAVNRSRLTLCSGQVKHLKLFCDSLGVLANFETCQVSNSKTVIPWEEH